MKVVPWTGGLALLLSLAVGQALAEDSGGTLAEHVWAANSRFKNVNVAIAEGYAPIPCTSGVDGGAMGVHYVNGEYLKDDVPDITRWSRSSIHHLQGTGLAGRSVVQLHRSPQ
jgi:hypothetical protein